MRDEEIDYVELKYRCVANYLDCLTGHVENVGDE